MGLEVRELNPRGKNVVLGERFGAWRVFGSYRRDLGLEGDGNPSNDSAGIWENGALQQEERTGVWGRLPYPIHDPLHPCRGLGAPQRPQVSLQEINREQGRGSFSEEIQAHHATMAPTREAIVRGVLLQEGDRGCGGHVSPPW